MITLYYHPEKKHWYHCEEKVNFCFGASNQIVSYLGSKQEHSLPIPVKRYNHEKVGPIVGILTGTSKNKDSFIGNIPSIRRILASLQNKGAIAVVVTPSSFTTDFVDGYTFYQPLKKWITLRTPLPDVIYNRIPYRRMEETRNFRETTSFLKENNIPFFNPYFFSKWDTYLILQLNHFLRRSLPHTILLQDVKDIQTMLQKHHAIYLKSTTGHKGIGLFYLKHDNHTITIETKDTTQSYPSLSSLLDDYGDKFMDEQYIIQEAIPSDKYEGKRYDLRILCHYQENQHAISGIGVRIAGEREITTHVPNGGSIIPFESVKDRFNEKVLQLLVYEIGKELSEKTDEFIGEFSIDLGRSITGEYFIYEVNSKPMVFDEEHIKRQGLENLTKLLIMKAKTT